jgi:hypothetical protein
MTSVQVKFWKVRTSNVLVIDARIDETMLLKYRGGQKSTSKHAPHKFMNSQFVSSVRNLLLFTTARRRRNSESALGSEKRSVKKKKTFSTVN